MSRILVRFVNDRGGWHAWDAMSELEHDGGGSFPKIEEDREIRTLWIRFDQSRVDEVLNAVIEGTVETNGE